MDEEKTQENTQEEENKEEEVEMPTPAQETIEILGAAVEEMINSIFEHIIAPYSVEEMRVLVEEDTTVIDLLRYLYNQIQNGEAKKWKEESKKRWNQTVKMLSAARKIAAKVGKPVVEQNFTTERAMYVFKERRPDIYKLLNTPNGQAWLQKNLNEIVEFLTKE